MSTAPRLWWLCIRLRESLCAVYYSDVHWSESNIKSFTAQGVSYKISPLFRFVCERNTLWFLNTFLQHFKNNCFLHHRHTHTQPAPPPTITTFNPAFHKADPVAMATGSTLGQVCRAEGHVTPAGTLLAETTFLFPPSHTGPMSPVPCCFHTFFSLLFLSRLYFRMTHRFP